MKYLKQQGSDPIGHLGLARSGPLGHVGSDPIGHITRRAFIGAAASASFLIGGCRLGRAAPRRPKPSERVTVGIIGCGTQAYTNVPMFLGDSRAQVVVVCDPVLRGEGYSYDGKHPGGRAVFKEKVDAHYGDQGCRMTADWREVVDDPSIDAVVVITPDHWHAAIAIAAMKAGKHVYCQKPMTLGISEGKEMVKVARETGVTFQVGSQHRGDSSFRAAGEIVANGLLGEVKEADVGLPGANGGMWGHGRDTSLHPRPAHFTREGWDMWLGPSLHWPDDAFIPAIHEPMCWRWNSRTGGGMITDWGAHWIDILQWTIGMERSGPVSVENMKTDLGDDPVLDWAAHYSFDLVYANGFRAHVSDSARCGILWKGAKGDVFADWSKLERPDFLRKWSERRDLKDGDVKFYRAKDGHGHEADFLDGIYESRPIATDCEIGHRSISACHIANICERLRLEKLAWDPAAERFTGAHAAEANALVEVPHHNGWSL